MRLSEIERGDGFANRLLIRFISMASGMRRSARVALYHKKFFCPDGALDAGDDARAKPVLA